MIVVTLNYRVNHFGFLTSKEMVVATKQAHEREEESTKQWYGESVGNWGLLDVAMGLEWIQDHISAFGVNPKRVSVMGEAAGASLISYMLQVPQFHGLLDRAILQSGAASSLPPVFPEHEGQRYFDELCQQFGVALDQGSSPEEILEMLRRIPEKEMAEAMNDSATLFFRPTIDNIVVKDDSRLSTQDASRYDPKLNWVLIGTCAEEGMPSSIYVG